MKNKKASLRREADKLWYQKYLKDYCEVCGSNYVLQGHHFYYKGSYSHLRYDKDNHITLCKGCHFVLHHQDPKKIEMKIIKKRGEKWIKLLQQKAKNRPSGSYLTIGYYEKAIEKLKRVIQKEFLYE